MTTENEGRVVTLYVCPICKKVQEYGPFTCPNSNVGSHEYAQTEPAEYVPKQELTQAEERVRVSKMEREWLLGAWAAAAGIDQAQAEAEFLAASAKWRDLAKAREALDSSTGSQQ